VLAHDQRHDDVQRRQRAVGQRVEAVARPQRPVWVLGLGALEVEEVRQSGWTASGPTTSRNSLSPGSSKKGTVDPLPGSYRAT
jgi:hypothetical protein